MNREIWNRIAFCGVGIFAGAMLAILMIKPIIDKLLSDNAEKQIQIAKLQQENQSVSLAAQAIAKQNVELRAQTNEILNEATVFYEPIPQNATSQTGLANLANLLLGHPVPAVQGMRPLWFIPAKVKPIFYGDPRGVQLIYVDGQGRKTGPFAPGDFAAMKTVKISLNEKAFSTLVAGGEVQHGEITITLADIGFPRMIEIIRRTINANLRRAETKFQEQRDCITNEETKRILKTYLGTECSSCKGKKRKDTAFCRGCYGRLPSNLQNQLWRRFGEGYEQAVIESEKWFQVQEAQGKLL